MVRALDRLGGAWGASFTALAIIFAAQGAAHAQSAPPTIVAFDGAAKPMEAAPDVYDPRTPNALETAPLPPMATAIRSMLKEGDLRDAYASNAFAPIWRSEDGAGGWSRALTLLDAGPVFQANALPQPDAKTRKLRERLAAADAPAAEALTPEEAAALDVETTRAFLRLASWMQGGAIEPRSVASDIDLDRPTLSTLDAVRRAREAADPVALLQSFAPASAEYRYLRQLRDSLLQAQADGDWGPEVKTKGSLRPMDRGPAVAALRARLVAQGYLDPTAPASLDAETGDTLFDGRVEEALRGFQSSHGLLVDGVAGANTLTEINVSPGERARQVAANMERSRWMNRDLGERRIVVNIADFRVRLEDHGRTVFVSDVVVGQARGHQTPEFSDEMTHVVVNPRWHVPYSIATEELLPILQQDPTELFRRNMVVSTPGGGVVDPWDVDWWGLTEDYFPYHLSQNSGPGNALGQVKFIFPNHHAVYLHDTPAKSLFSKPQRDFSHGCIRVAKPVELAETLLGEQRSDPRRYFYQLVDTREESFVELAKHLPVHITYRTAWVDENGALQLRRDVYGRDHRLEQAMKSAGVAL